MIWWFGLVFFPFMVLQKHIAFVTMLLFKNIMENALIGLNHIYLIKFFQKLIMYNFWGKYLFFR
jgi:hypothetical protein